MLWIRNSFFYGAARLSQVAIYGLVALWFEVGSETDSFFLAYAVAMFFYTGASSTLSQVLVPYLARAPRGAQLYFLAYPCIGVTLLARLVGSPLLATLGPMVGFGVSSSYLAGRLTAKGVFWRPPFAVLLGSLVTAVLAWKLHQLQGLSGMGLALSGGEIARWLFLQTRLKSLEKDYPRLPAVKEFWTILPIILLLGLSPVIVRFLLVGFLSPGYVTVFSYAWGLMGILLSVTTTGLVVTEGRLWKDLSLEDLRKRYLSFFPKLSAAILCITAAALCVLFIALRFFLGASSQESEILKVLIVLVVGLPVYVIAGAALPPMIILRKSLYLGVITGGHLLATTVLLIPLVLVQGLPGAAVAMVTSECLLAYLMIRSFVRVPRRNLERPT